MAMTIVATDIDKEIEENIREQREILSRCFSEARRRLDEREAQLSLQFEEKIKEIKIHTKKIATDIHQLNSALEQLQACLSSNTLQETGNDAIKPIKNKIGMLEREELRVQFNWSPHNLYSEINKIGETTTIPARIQFTCISEDNIREQSYFKVVTPPPYEQQKQEISSILTKPFQKGDLYVIHLKWFNEWRHYVGYDDCDKSVAGEEVAKPGPIDNTSLLDQDKFGKLLGEGKDHQLVPEEAWYKLLSWYRIKSMGMKKKIKTP